MIMPVRWRIAVDDADLPHLHPFCELFRVPRSPLLRFQICGACAKMPVYIALSQLVF